MNAKMSELKRCFEKAGFTAVKTLLSSGNVVFSSSQRSLPALEQKIERAMEKTLGRVFYTIVRPTDELQKILASDPFSSFHVRPEAKRIITFMREHTEPKIRLPISQDGSAIYLAEDRHVYSAYIPNKKGPLFMALIEKTFGKNVTTRTWGTVQKVSVV